MSRVSRLRSGVSPIWRLLHRAGRPPRLRRQPADCHSLMLKISSATRTTERPEYCYSNHFRIGSAAAECDGSETQECHAKLRSGHHSFCEPCRCTARRGMERLEELPSSRRRASPAVASGNSFSKARTSVFCRLAGNDFAGPELVEACGCCLIDWQWCRAQSFEVKES